LNVSHKSKHATLGRLHSTARVGAGIPRPRL